MVTLHFIIARKLLDTGTTLLQGFRIASKCCAPVLRTASYPRQFGEGEHGVFAGDIVPKTLTLLLKRST